MSNQTNTDILERAGELAEECTNSMLGDQLDNALNEKPQDLERIQSLSGACERHLEFVDRLER